jgi:PAS domain S-box-containing protein
MEHLDLTHFDDNRHLQLLLDLYRHKYSNPKPDLIIPVLNRSVDLILKYGENLFPDVPIVFGGVEKQFIESRSVRSNITGYLTDINYTGTLELALNLHPKTRNIAVIAGAGPVVKKWINSCRRAYQTYEDRIDFIYLTGLPMERLLREMKNLSPNTVVISLPVLIDGAGRKFVGNESLAQITKASVAPVYTFWDVCLGTGVVGGYMGSFEQEAKAVAQLGLRILNGEKPEEIPIADTPKYITMFDWRQLKRWSIDEARLPPGSIVMFKNLSTWDKYKGRIIGAFVLILFQALIIFYLLYQRKIKRMVEQSFRTVADYTYDWEYWQNPNGSLQYVSPSCKRICGYSAKELMANSSLLEDMIAPEDKVVWDEHRCNVRKEMKSGEVQFRIQRPDGEIRWIEHACQPVIDNRGNNQGIRASNRDITKRKLYKSETTKLQSELAHMDRVVTIGALTSALAHEINQPLSAMRSYAQAALRFMDNDKPEFDNIRKALEGIVSDNKRAAAVVNRLRDLVKKGKVR